MSVRPDLDAALDELMAQSIECDQRIIQRLTDENRRLRDENRDLRDEVNWLHAELQAWEDEGVRLPRDVDGIPIRVGDRVIHKSLAKSVVVIGVGNDDFFYQKGAGFNWFFHAHEAHHYHKPTVEDVIVEYAEKFHNSKMMLEAFDYDALRREYAAKIREVMAHDRD